MGFFVETATDTDWGRDIAKIVTNLHVIDNNVPGNRGGGPTTDFAGRYGSKAPPFGNTVGNQRPQVTITSPTIEAFPEGDAITLTASASDNSSVRKVEFYADGAKIGEAAQAPYTVNWTNPTFGRKTVLAKAIDDQGLPNFSEPVFITVGYFNTYEEDFNDAAAQGWTPQGGVWSLTQNFYGTYDAAGISSTVFADSLFTDIIYSLRAEPYFDNNWGVLFHVQDALNYCLLELDANPKQAKLKEISGNDTTLLASGTYSGGGKYKWNDVTVETDGNLATVYVNGSLIFDAVTTPTYSSGKIGLWAAYNSISFDDLKVGHRLRGSLSDTVPPSAPVNLRVSNATETTIDLAWDAAVDNLGVSRYELTLNGTLQGSATTPSYNLSGLAANTTYEVSVSAYDNADNSSPSSVLSVTTGGSATNLVKNYDFENSGTNWQQPSNWSSWSPANAHLDADYFETYAGYNSANHLTHWKNAPYEVYTYQTITGLPDGIYTLKAWVKRSGTFAYTFMEVKEYGGTKIIATVPNTTAWSQIAIPNVNVTNGQCVIGFYTVATAPFSYVHVDDVEFYQSSLISTRSAQLISKTPSSEEATSGIEPLEVYPNPGENFIILRGAPLTEGLSVAVVDLSGRTVFSENRVNGENNRFYLPTDRLKSGSYIVRVTSSTDTYVRKFILKK